jgi:hypothetical protein
MRMARRGAVVLVRTRPGNRDMARVLRSIERVRRVEHLKGPYDLLVYADERDGIDAIARLPGVRRAGVCWLLPRSEGAGS